MAIALETSQNIAFGTGTSLSTSITVDANADCVLVFFASWNNSSTNQVTACTLGGVSPDETRHLGPGGNASSNQHYVAAFYAPSSGSKTLALTLAAGSTDGPTCQVVQLSGVDATTGIRDSGWNGYPQGDNSPAWPNSVTVTTVADDWVLHNDYAYDPGSGLPGTQSGWTSIVHQNGNNGSYARTSYIQASGTSVTAEGQDENYSGSLVIVLAPEAGGPTEVTKTDTLAATDANIQRRLRDREALDNAAVTDDVTATYVPSSVVNNVTLQDLDSIAVSDLSPAERLRDRENLDSIIVGDLNEEQRQRVREQLEELSTTDSFEAERQRVRSSLDAAVVTDSAIVTGVEGADFSDYVLRVRDIGSV